MTSMRPIVATLGIVAVLAVVALLSTRHRPPAAPQVTSETPTPTPVPGRLVLFFPGDDALLHREAREVPEIPAGVLPRMRLVLEELIAGSHEGFAPAFPWSPTVQAVFLDRDGDAYVDLSAPPADLHAGTDIELAVAYSAVNSVVANCPGVRRVQLLAGGREIPTLGHLDLSRPLAPDLEIVAP